MIVKVKDRQTSNIYILIGTGYGMFQSQKPNWMWGNISPDTESGDKAVVCVCDKQGKMFWLSTDRVEVVSIDGAKPEQLL